MRRMISVLSVAALMAAMMVAMAMPAFAVANENANPQGQRQSTFTCAGGQDVAAAATGDIKHSDRRLECATRDRPGESQ